MQQLMRVKTYLQELGERENFGAYRARRIWNKSCTKCINMYKQIRKTVTNPLFYHYNRLAGVAYDMKYHLACLIRCRTILGTGRIFGKINSA